MKDYQIEMIRLRKAVAREKDAKNCPDAATQTSRGTVKVAIFSYCRRKCADSPIITMYLGIRAFHRKLEA